MPWNGLNRRKFPRALYPCLIKIEQPEGEGGNILTHTENIGIGGVCIISKTNIKPFSTVGIELDLLDIGEHLKCRGRVIWNIRRKATETKKPNFYDIGIEYVDLDKADRKRLEEMIATLAKRGAAIILKPFGK